MSPSRGIECQTGIDEWSKTGVFEPERDGLFLLKLHGSIDWMWERDVQTAERPMPHSIIRRVGIEQIRRGIVRPAVVFGQRNKLTAEGPFLDLLRAFQRELSRSAVLTVIGYSFRDPHINVYVSQWLNQSSQHRIRIVDPSFEEGSIEYRRELRNLRNQSPGRVEVVAKRAGEALEQMYGKYEEAAVDKTSQEPDSQPR
jgi:hypothetical protein